MNQLRLTSLMMVAAAATLGIATGCSSSSSKGGTGGAGGGVVGLGGKTGGGGSTGTGGAAGGSPGTAGAAGGSTGTGGAAGGSPGTAGAAGGSTGTGGAAGGSPGTAGAAGGSSGGGGAGGSAITTLLVDHDNSDNNNDPTDTTATPSPSDTLFSARLTAEHIPFKTFVVPNVSNPTTPAFTDLMPYSNVVWYTADVISDLITASQQSTLQNWLDVGGKTLLVFSQSLFYDIGGSGTWTTPTTNTFLTNYVGAAGWVWDVKSFAGGQDTSVVDQTYSVAGAAGTAFAGLQFTIISDTPIDSTADVVNPGTGTVPLVTALVDPTEAMANTATPIAVLHTVGTSKVLYVGLPVEDIQGAPTNTSADFIHAALKSLALVP